jgi:NAD(P)-dependent dehydrogenase (short-subunit alcohol dehydrogenase family)
MAARGPRFEGKVALITGGNAGLGLAAALAFAAEGASVLIAARRRAQGEEAAAQIHAAGGKAAFVETDVADSASVKHMVAECIARFGRLDIAFNNAGITGPVAFEIADADEAAYDQVMAVNARGTWLCMKYEIPEMLKLGGGAIINCSSYAGLRGGVRNTPYYASKHAIVGMTKAAAMEYAARNIRVNAICPGLIATDMVTFGFAGAEAKLEALKAKIPAQRIGLPEEVASAVLWLAAEESGFVNGVALPIDGATSA